MQYSTFILCENILSKVIRYMLLPFLPVSSFGVHVVRFFSCFFLSVILHLYAIVFWNIDITLIILPFMMIFCIRFCTSNHVYILIFSKNERAYCNKGSLVLIQHALEYLVKFMIKLQHVVDVFMADSFQKDQFYVVRMI